MTRKHCDIVIVILMSFIVGFCLGATIRAAQGDTPISVGHGKMVAWFYPEMNKKATLITRSIDCKAGVVIYTANSHTYGYAVATSVVPIKDTLLLYKEVCNGTNKSE